MAVGANKKNFIDNVVSYISPEAGVKRAKARRVQEFIDQRAYDGASKGRRTDGWFTLSTDANSEIRCSLQIMRDRSREQNRNNPVATRATDVIVSNTIGYGIKTQFIKNNLPSEAHNKLWKSWAEKKYIDSDLNSDIFGLQHLAMRTLVESGAAIIKRERLLNAERGTIPFRVQVLEPDFIDHSKDGSGDMIQGVQFKDGKVIGYWMFDRHPGGMDFRSLNSKLVLVEDVKMMIRKDRAGQIHGIPWSHAVMITLKELDEYMDATLVKQKISAAFAAFVHDIEGFAEEGTASKSTFGEVIEPGIVEVLPSGKSITFSNPPTVTDFDPFTRAQIRRVAIGMGTSYEALSGDLSGVNFSSARMGWLEFQRNIDSWRWHTFVPQFSDVIAEWFLDSCKMLGIKSDGVEPMHTAPRREMIDPTSETSALITAIRGGITTLKAVHTQLGEDHEQVLTEIASTNKLLDQNELILDSDPRRVMKAGIVQSGIDAASIGDTEGVDSGKFYQDESGQIWERSADGYTRI